jgi:hypothetical protein
VPAPVFVAWTGNRGSPALQEGDSQNAKENTVMEVTDGSDSGHSKTLAPRSELFAENFQLLHARV